MESLVFPITRRARAGRGCGPVRASLITFLPKEMRPLPEPITKIAGLFRRLRTGNLFEPSKRSRPELSGP